jgi:DNA-binding MarR family transcriptional regulator
MLELDNISTLNNHPLMKMLFYKNQLVTATNKILLKDDLPSFSLILILQIVADNKHLNQLEIAKYCNLSTPAISRQIKILASKKMVKKYHTISNKRSNQICLTKNGSIILETSSKVLKQYFDSQLSYLTPQENKEFHKIWISLLQIK